MFTTHTQRLLRLYAQVWRMVWEVCVHVGHGMKRGWGPGMHSLGGWRAHSGWMDGGV